MNKNENRIPREAFQMSMFGKDAPCKEINGIYVSDGIEENKSIFRYMNLEYLHAMLRSGKLYLPNRQRQPLQHSLGHSPKFRLLNINAVRLQNLRAIFAQNHSCIVKIFYRFIKAVAFIFAHARETGGNFFRYCAESLSVVLRRFRNKFS